MTIEHGYDFYIGLQGQRGKGSFINDVTHGGQPLETTGHKVCGIKS